MDVLDQEAEEDEQFRSERSTNRLSSHEANQDLVGKAAKYRGVLEQASQSDEIVRTKWDEWETNITELTWDEVISLLPVDLMAKSPTLTPRVHCCVG